MERGFKLPFFRLILCICLFIFFIEAGVKTTLLLFDSDRQFDVVDLSIEIIVKISVFTYFAFIYRNTLDYPDIRRFFSGLAFLGKYFCALIIEMLVTVMVPTVWYKKMMITIPIWLSTSVAIFCLVLFVVLLLYMFVPKQYVFQWQMDYDDVNLRKIVGEVQSSEMEKKLEEDEQLIKKIIHEQTDDTYSFEKKFEEDEDLKYAIEITWSKEGIKGVYRTSNTSEYLYEARCRAAQYLEKNGINVAVGDLRYVPE